ncbi:VOC family protein [Amycolatopsis cihanbeyliensis]
MTRMTLTLGMVTIDCTDQRVLAEFWTKALGGEIGQDYGEFLILTPGSGGGPVIGLQRVPEPRAGKNRVHLDFGAEDREAEVARLIGLGATRLEEHTIADFSWTVLADPEGNVFCVGPEHG